MDAEALTARVQQLEGQLREASIRREQLRLALRQQTENLHRLEGALTLARDLLNGKDGSAP